MHLIWWSPTTLISAWLVVLVMVMASVAADVLQFLQHIPEAHFSPRNNLY